MADYQTENFDRALTIDQLIAKLQRLRKEHGGNLKCGFTNDFGEFLALDKYDLSIKWDTSRGWENRIAEWVEVSVPGEMRDYPC